MRSEDILEAFLERRYLIDKGFDIAVGLIVAALLYLCSQLVKLAYGEAHGLTPPVTSVPAPPPARVLVPVALPPPPPPPPKPGIEQLSKGQIVGSDGQPFADSYDFRCTDEEGVEGEFRAAIFLHQYNWKYGSDGVELADTRQNFDSILHEEGLREALGKARELIAIGTASCEGGKEGEEVLAARRALKLSAKVRAIIAPPFSAPPISAYYVNLGQFQPGTGASEMLCNGKSSAETRPQRKIILVAIDRKDRGPDLRGCLGKVLAKCPDLDRYSHFNDFELRW